MSDSASPDPRKAAAISALLIALIAIPTILTLCTVQVPNGIVRRSENPTPHGYTVALLFWIIPAVAIALWLLPSERLHARRAFWITVMLLVPIGFLGEFFFVWLFWDFPNLGATMGILAPALHNPVPIEEYIFYVAAFVCTLLLYIWLDEYWVSAYQSTAQPTGKLIRFHPWSLVIAVLLIAG